MADASHAVWHTPGRHEPNREPWQKMEYSSWQACTVLTYLAFEESPLSKALCIRVATHPEHQGYLPFHSQCSEGLVTGILALSVPYLLNYLQERDQKAELGTSLAWAVFKMMLSGL